MSTDDKVAAGVAAVKSLIIDIQQNRNYDLIEKVVHEDFVDHTGPPGEPQGRPCVLAKMKLIHSLLSDIQMEIVHCFGDGSMVATNKIMRGVQVADFPGKPATNARIEFRIMDFVTIVDGKIKEHWATMGPIVDL
nr:hypothetical protein CFP56_02631 [Quercus suber]